jgi:hypothetical protein
MSLGQTSAPERHRLVDLKLKGYSLREIAEQTGWSFYCVRHRWQRYRDGGRAAFNPPGGRKQSGGHMSTFPGIVHFAFLRIEKYHPK